MAAAQSLGCSRALNLGLRVESELRCGYLAARANGASVMPDDAKGSSPFQDLRLIRSIDVVLSAVGLIISAPILGVCAIVVRATSPGPALFAQERVGRGRKPFVCYKLRTMQSGTRIAATHEIGESRLTPPGSFLRRTKLDELPQLWNVFVGEMSLVGSRPCLPIQTALIDARDKRGVYRSRPGITGAAQVRGIDMSDPERLALTDEQWVHEMSVGFYLHLIVLTILGQGQGDRVSG
jgi:O-antigen biosynthesis protein WbqP